MEVVCSHCSRVLQFSGEPPRFCGYCGHLLSPDLTIGNPQFGQTLDYSPNQAATLTREDKTWELPETVGGYRILRLLGTGGMGAVYEAEEPAQKKLVALKLVSAQYSHSAETLQRFRREGLLASSLVHPRCVFVLAADEEAGRPYIVMELMPGRTLQDLVREQGPLRPIEAIPKILDVMEGLEEAHSLGVVHRDVKPSNCFLEENGRVKIGDFGLAKSLARDGNLTRTGAFMGTPQYAAPEQIRAEVVDAQSDVYSVAATLYFLLVGRAPFQGVDPVATMAAIVSESAPSLRSLQARLSPKLDRVVLKGLERDRKKRWQTLDEFRQALATFIPSEPSIAGLGLRFSAYLLDFLLIFFFIYIPCHYLLENDGLKLLVAAVLDIAYFGLTEGLWGQSLGKRLFGLRVVHKETIQVPGILPAVWRASILEACWMLNESTNYLWGFLKLSSTATEWLSLLEFGAPILLLCVTMRRRNGFRGVHELLSGTATALLQGRRRRHLIRPRGSDFQPPIVAIPELPARIGSFQVVGAMRWDDQEKVVLAEDPALGRKVWIWRRPGDAVLPEARHQLNRATRMRWLLTVELDDANWECFLAPSGSPLELIRNTPASFDWEISRPLLEELVEEIVASNADGTLPSTPECQQIWIQPTGRLLLVDLPQRALVSSGAPKDQNLALVRDTAIALMATPVSGRPGMHDVPVPMPAHARKIMSRLLGEAEYRKSGKPVAEPFHKFEEVQQVFQETHDLPMEVSRSLRSHQLMILAALSHLTMLAPLGWYALSFIVLRAHWLKRNDYEIPDMLWAGVMFYMVSILVLWCAWSFLVRGGLSYRLAGIHLRRTDGRKAARWQCALRVLLVWGPIVCILIAAILVHETVPQIAKLALAMWLGAVLLIPAYLWSALRSPSQALHDRILGIYLVPN
jgi:uncharacterized RDD family membrane protein YckC